MSKATLAEHCTYKRLFKFVLPSIFMMAITSVYTIVDGLFVSNLLGTTSFAALNMAVPFVMILGGMGFMIGTGGTALVSKTMGEGDYKKANGYFTMLIVFSTVFGILLTVIGLIFMRPISIRLGAEGKLLEDCVIYGQICIAFTTCFMLQNIFQSFLAAAGKPTFGLVITVIAGLTNAALDALFIAVFKWGIAGAALATGIGQVVGGAIPLVYFCRKNSSLLRFSKFKFEIMPILKSCFNGSSELLTSISSSIVGMLYNYVHMQYLGKNGVAASGVLMYVQFIFIAIEIGYAIGVSPLIGYNYGAQNHNELKNILKKSLIIMSVCGLILTAIAQIFTPQLVSVFVGYDRELFDLTAHGLRLFSLTFIFTGVNIFSSGFFTSLNNGVVSGVLSFLRALVFQVLCLLVMPLIFSVDGIWSAAAVAEGLSLIAAIIFFVCYRKKYHYA